MKIQEYPFLKKKYYILWCWHLFIENIFSTQISTFYNYICLFIYLSINMKKINIRYNETIKSYIDGSYCITPEKVKNFVLQLLLFYFIFFLNLCQILKYTFIFISIKIWNITICIPLIYFHFFFIKIKY